MYNVKISFTMPYRANDIKNTNLGLYPREIAKFIKFAKMYTRENIHIFPNPPLGELRFQSHVCVCTLLSIP